MTLWLWRLVYSRSRFERDYVNASKVTVEKLGEYGKRAYSCDCGEGGCKGWAMLTEEFANDPMSRGGRVGP